MSDLLEVIAAPGERPRLPRPTLTRWQPLRIGLVELFRYDSEEFWFRDGHLLLRGNNGTGKSKVLALTLPFLFDAKLTSARLEPDGDPGKKMAWNLLLGNSYDRRTGYAWIELGRVAADGTPQFVTLGAGLMANAARPQVESWYFVADGPRIGRDIWLTTAQRNVLTKDRLRNALEGTGHVFENAKDYRRAVDERLFHLGATRYSALMDTLVQLRQPQLSKRPDEANLSKALTESLPPLAPELLADVAEALTRLEDDRRELQEHQELERAVTRFERQYRLYAGTQSRRQARGLRQAQTEFDNASRAFNESQTRLDTARADELRAQVARDEAVLELAAHQSRLDTLRSDPTMQDANRLEQAQRDAAARHSAAADAKSAFDDATARLNRAKEKTRTYALRAERCQREVDDARRGAAERAAAVGVTARFAGNLLWASASGLLADVAPRAFDAAVRHFHGIVAARRDEIALIRLRQAALAQAEVLHVQRRETLDEQREAAERAADRRTAADVEVERAGEALVSNWRDFFASLHVLRVAPDAPLAELLEWVVAPTTDNPAWLALRRAQQEAAVRFGARRSELDAVQRTIEDEDGALAGEQHRLEAGEDAAPPTPYTREANARTGPRPGAPLWQLLEFRDGVDAGRRAGLEAALEAAGLLDAWLAPDGHLVTVDGRTVLSDTNIVARPRRRSADSTSLADLLRPAAVADQLGSKSVSETVAPEIVGRVLACIASGDDDSEVDEAWIAPDGRFRLGVLAGAWTKTSAVYIGFAARAAARLARLARIAERRAELTAERTALDAQLALHAQSERSAQDEWLRAPSDEPLTTALLSARVCARDYTATHERFVRAQERFMDSERALRAVQRSLTEAATDLQLPVTAEALSEIEAQLAHFDRSMQILVQAARELRANKPELTERHALELDAEADRNLRGDHLAASLREAHEAAARWEVLRDAVGAQVQELQARLARAVEAIGFARHAAAAAESAVRTTGEARAVATEQNAGADRILRQCTDTRAASVSRFQAFVATGLLSSALGESGLADLPDMRVPWTIDPALSVARRSEQALLHIDDGDEARQRADARVATDLTELQRALTALGHQAQGEPNEYGFIVHIIYHNRLEAPNQLAKKLTGEIGQRRELLTATEREVLENHLQAEIATEVRRLLVAADRQVNAINAELHKHPTSTGVRYRLQWMPIAEGGDGAPVGLDAARKRLLNTSSDLWSAEDRRVVGAMLQGRIAAERERGDAAGSGALPEQLASALDYRRWHEFRVQRWQDGQWRKLSGPASSGERALGLTVPLFAAVASFYTQSGYDDAPRLVLLDEAFAGIDASARAHCMALIREFDLDFAITSESEWACYAELPGVSICHLQRREGIDAVLVSRWSWDGRARRPEIDPDSRFPPS